MSERIGSVYDIEAIKRAAGEPGHWLAGKWRFVVMGDPAPAGDDWVVVDAAEYERWREDREYDIVDRDAI